MGCLELPSALTAFTGKLRCWKREKPADSRFEEKRVISHNSKWSVRNPFLDMPAGEPFDIVVKRVGSKVECCALALRDSQIKHSIVSATFAAKHKINVEKDLSGLPSVSVDSSASQYELQGYFPGTWWLPNTYATVDGWLAVTTNQLPNNVDALLLVSENQLGVMRTSADQKRLNLVMDPKKTQAQDTADKEQLAAQSKLESEQDRVDLDQTKKGWAQKIKKAKEDRDRGQANSVNTTRPS